MAAPQLKLVLRQDGGADSTTVDLLDGTDDFNLARDGWIQGIQSPYNERVDEVISLRVSASSKDALACAIRKVDEKVRETRQYWGHPGEFNSVWLRAQLEDETYARQAVIYDLRTDHRTHLMQQPAASGFFVREYNLALTRGMWEDTACYTYYSSASVIAVAGSARYDFNQANAVVKGDEPARLTELWLASASAGNDDLDEVWVGFRTTRFGPLNGWTPRWNCTCGTAGTDTVNKSDALATGCVHTTDFASGSAMAMRSHVSIFDIIGTPGTSCNLNMRGTWDVLLRSKVTAGTTVRARLQSGACNSLYFRTHQRQTVTASNWYLHPMGSVRIPPGRTRENDSFALRGYALRIQAERSVGAGSFYSHCLCLIPTAEGAIHIKGGSMGTWPFGGPAHSDIIRQYPDGTLAGFNYQAGEISEDLALDAQNYGLPTGSGMFVMCAQQYDVNNEADGVEASAFAYPRWRTLRGADV